VQSCKGLENSPSGQFPEPPLTSTPPSTRTLSGSRYIPHPSHFLVCASLVRIHPLTSLDSPQKLQLVVHPFLVPGDMDCAKGTAVAGLYDDLMVEILSCVPVKDVRRSKCVSKPWRDLIADPLHRKKLP